MKETVPAPLEPRFEITHYHNLYCRDGPPVKKMKLQQAEKLLKARNTQIKNLSQRLTWLANNRSPKMSKQLHRQVLSLLHPDLAHGDEAMRERLEKCFQEFSVVEFAFPEDD